MQNNFKNHPPQKKQHLHKSAIKQRKWPTPLNLVLSTEESQTIDLDRPKIKSSMLSHSKNYPSAPNQSRVDKLLASKAFYQAEQSIMNEVPSKLSGYLIGKFKQYLTKMNTLEIQKNLLEPNHNPESSLSKSVLTNENQVAKECKGCHKIPKRQNMTPQLRVKNAREKIYRLIELKNNKEAQFSEFEECLRAKCLKTEKKRRKNPVLTNEDLVQIQKEKWDKQWVKEYNSELARYRTRVLKKGQKYQRSRFHDL